MATAGAILVQESSLDDGQAQFHLLNIEGTGGGPTTIVQGTQTFIADIRPLGVNVTLSSLTPVVTLATINVEVDLEEELNI